MASDRASAIVWFRDDLRTADHPALAAAAAAAPRALVCLYVLDEQCGRPLGGAARWWLAGSLRTLDHGLRKLGNRLVLRRGAAAQILAALATETGAGTVYWYRRYATAEIALDRRIEDALRAHSVAVETFQANVLFEPQRSGKSFRVFTPFWRRMCAGVEPRDPLPAPDRLPAAPRLESARLADWQLEPTRPDWAAGLRATWIRGETAGRTQLEKFLASGLHGYPVRRDRPDIDGTSCLSPHLRFGEISPFQAWHAARFAGAGDDRLRPGVEKFLAELGWREFNHHLLHDCPDLARRNLQEQFDRFAWSNDAQALRAWQAGRTGYPVVDAGMRQLWQTGWMHNRVRMIVASFLVKHLLIDWRQGESWFWDTLVDADPANNPANWQWVAGSGADAAPYFRIFNPVLQGEKFDPDGSYVRRFVPELSRLPARFIHKPWTAPDRELWSAGVTLGASYPHPIVDHAAARRRALDAYAGLKKIPGR
jgi:deoxyribodipyrimidine photo-lyase